MKNPLTKGETETVCYELCLRASYYQHLAEEAELEASSGSGFLDGSAARQRAKAVQWRHRQECLQEIIVKLADNPLTA